MSIASALASMRRTPARLREAVAPDLDVVDAGPVVRVLFATGVAIGAIGVAVWASMSVRRLAVDLDKARAELEVAQIDQQRLLVERALLRDPGRLGALAAGMRLESPQGVVDVPRVEAP
jgi:cell division protein FtsL